MKQRILSLFLALTLLFSLAPTVFAADNSFTDVNESDWFYAPVQWAVEQGITGGIGNNRFGPNNQCTRGQVVTFLWAAAGKPEPTMLYNPFSDVSSSDYYYKAVIWAVQEGITGGLTPSTFGPNEICTRVQVVTFLWAAAKKPSPEATTTSFTDVAASDWFCTPVLWAVENGITSGLTPTSFGSHNQCTRGQIVTFLYAARNMENSPAVDEEAKQEFEAKTIYDFPEHLVLNFDNDPETNFGVLNENVIRWEDKPITAEKIFIDEQSKYVFSDADALKDIPLGSVIYVLSPTGTAYLVSLGEVAGSVVTPAKDLPLSAYYTYLDTDIVAKIDTDAIRSNNENHNTAARNNEGLTFTPNIESGVTVGGKVSSEAFELGLTGSIICATGGHVEYDVEVFSEDYIDFWMESTVAFNAELTGTLKGSETTHTLNRDLEIEEFPLATIVPGLDLTMELKLPVKVEAEVGFTGTLQVAKTKRIEYTNDYDKPLITEKENSDDGNINCKGKVELKAGVAAEIGADFLDDKLELVLELKVMGGVRGTPEFPDHDISSNPTTAHMCDVCIKGEIFVEISGKIKFQVNISKKTKVELITIPLLKLEIPLDAFYVSMESPEDSVHQGHLTFGMGSCPNCKRRVTFITQLFDGTPLKDPVMIELTKTDTPTVTRCNSNEYVYLYDGTYTAAIEYNGERGIPVIFTLKGFSEEVTLRAARGPEKEIYTDYLLDGGYYDLTHTNFYYEYNADIKTVCIDLDGNGIQELLLRYTDNNFNGAGHLNTFTALYTIDENSGEVVRIADFSSGSPSSLSFIRNTVNDEHCLMLHSYIEYDKTGENNSSVYTVQHWNGQNLVPGDSFRIDQFQYPCVDDQYADEIESILNGPYTAYDYSNIITAYFINDVQVSREEYYKTFNPGSATDARYKWHYGSYRNPIK